MSKEQAATKALPVVKQEVLDLADKIVADLAVDKKAGVVSENESVYDKNLPEGLTTEIVKDVSDYNTTFIAASTKAFGDLAIQALKGNKDLTVVAGSIRMGAKDELALNMERSHEYPNRAAGEGATIVKHGVVSASYEVKAGKNGGQLKAVRAQLAAEGSKALAK